MAKRILIAYDTVYGSTAEVAEFLGKSLSKEGNMVDVNRLTEIQEVKDYQAILLGSPIMNAKVTEDTISFIRQYHDQLCNRHLALFIVCLTARSGSSTRESAVFNYINPILRDYVNINPVTIGIFAGVLDYDKYPDAVKETLQGLYRKSGGPTEGRHDYRNWNAITMWAKEVNTKI